MATACFEIEVEYDEQYVRPTAAAVDGYVNPDMAMALANGGVDIQSISVVKTYDSTED